MRCSFGHVFQLAIFAGWFIALTTRLVETTERTLAQIVLIWLTIAPIGAFGFRHSIAGAVEAFYLNHGQVAAERGRR